jgi:hypothetical protein
VEQEVLCHISSCLCPAAGGTFTDVRWSLESAQVQEDLLCGLWSLQAAGIMSGAIEDERGRSLEYELNGARLLTGRLVKQRHQHGSHAPRSAARLRQDDHRPACEQPSSST